MDQFPIYELSPDILQSYFGHIPDPPDQLFIRGTFPTDSHLVFLTVVGSRNHTPYGKEVCEQLIRGLRGYPIVIVSGLAFGIDAIAHETALAEKILTVSFPGSGLGQEIIAPRSNFQLAQRILDAGGCLLSEYTEYEDSEFWMFPQRNRLMAGLSRATLIIEATHKSGSRITTKLATDYNRDVLAVPGSILNQLSEAPNDLIRLGAIPITSSRDILEALGFEITESERKPADLFSQCTPIEERVLRMLNRPLPRGEIIRQLELPIHKANILLSQMEIRGFIKETAGEIRRV